MSHLISLPGVIEAETLETMKRYTAITHTIKASSAPIKGTYVMLGDWPHKVAKVKQLGGDRYRVTYIR